MSARYPDLLGTKGVCVTPSLSRQTFTLVEMLTVICLITILVGIGFGRLKQLSEQMDKIFTTSDAKQLISSTIQEARRNQVPMVVKFKISNATHGEGSGDYTMMGSQNSMVAYWNFGDDQQGWSGGINRINLQSTTTPTTINGVLGKCVQFGGGTILSASPSDRLNCDSDFYFECQIKANLFNIASVAASSYPTICNGGNGKMKLNIQRNSITHAPYLEATGLSGNAQNTPFPEDGLWHKVGLSKIQDLGVFLYLDDLLIGCQRVASAPGNSPHGLELGENFYGAMDEVKFYRLGQGQDLVMKGDGVYFGFEAYDPAAGMANQLYTLQISPFGIVNGLYKEGNSTPIFKAHSYVYMQMDLHCVVDLNNTQYTTLNNSTSPKHISQLDNVVKSKDQNFPDTGYAWVRASTSNVAAEIVRYSIYSSGSVKKLKVLSTDELGTDGSSPLGLSQVILQYVEPITVTRTGEVL